MLSWAEKLLNRCLALPNRTNIVITRKKDYLAENAIVTNSLR